MAGVFDRSLECLGSIRLSTKPQRGVRGVIERMARCVRDAVDECDLKLSQIRAVGVGAPGGVDSKSGMVLFAPNLGWKRVPLKRLLEKALGRTVVVENDCNLSMIGIYQKELRAKPRDVVGIFLGTGIGGGLVLGGRTHKGFNSVAGEVGHMVIDRNGPRCGCGNRGCFEALAGRGAIFRRIRQAVKAGEKTVLTTLLGKELAGLRSGHLRKAVRRRDKLVTRIVREVAECAGIAVANLVNLLNPEVVVMGGGLVEALEDEVMPVIRRHVLEHAFPGAAKGLEIRASKLGDESGIVGGAVLALRVGR